MRGYLAMLAISCLLTGCLAGHSTMGTLKPEPFVIEGTDTVNIGFSGLKDKGYHVKVRETKETWELVNISLAPLKIDSDNEELLFFNKNLTYVQPEFILWKESQNSPTYPHFICSPSDGNLRKASKQNSYNPCNSALTSYLLIADVYINKEKIANIIRQTGLLPKLHECKTQQAKAMEEMDRLLVIEPQIFDKSGFYRGNENIFSVSKKVVSSNDCPSDIEYSVRIRPIKSDYDTDIETETYHARFSSNVQKLKPVILINTRDFKDFYPDYVNEDSALMVVLNNGKLHFYNKKDQFIQIYSISVRYNSEVSNIDLKEANRIEIPPLSRTKDPYEIKDIINKNIIEKAQFPKLTKELAMKRTIRFGFAVKYRTLDQHIDKTLYKENTYNLYSAIMDSDNPQVK
ncbi:MAG TPA: hypothetical protein VK448_00810 [Dissulfurispiraceae bacterium]|nr:hypothetical protein [Dissulfurispiraceae bacterium]